MNAIPDGWKVVRCAECREPINQLMRPDAQSVTYCARCTPRSPEERLRIDTIRRAAMAARARRELARSQRLHR
jgi:hypothetical protein